MEKVSDGNLVDLSTIITDVLNVVFDDNKECLEDEEILTMIGGLDG